MTFKNLVLSTQAMTITTQMKSVAKFERLLMRKSFLNKKSRTYSELNLGTYC